MKRRSGRIATHAQERTRRVEYRPAKPSTDVVTVALVCGHSNEFDSPAPTAGQTVYCRTCDSYNRVKETPDA